MNSDDHKMNGTANTNGLLPLGLLGRWIFERGELWQMDLLNADGLADFCRDRNLSSLRREYIRRLWSIGIVRSDLVVSFDSLSVEGLIDLGRTEDGRHWYSDARPIPSVETVLDLLKDVPEPDSGIELHFHPFRSYVLHNLEQWSNPNVAPYQAILRSEGYAQVLNWWIQIVKDPLRGNYQPRLQHLTNVAELVIACEPCIYGKVFSLKRWHGTLGETQFDELVDKHRQELGNHFQLIDQAQIVSIHEELCWSARILDNNQDVHTLLRLTEGEFRLKRTRSNLGGAICMLIMAEILRRFAEHVYNIQLPEEDEVGSGPLARSIKQRLYGSTRLFDGNRKSSNEYLRQFDLDHGVRIRWYVEGETEYGALESAVGADPSIELINLGGHVAQSRGRGAAFRDNLLNDIKAQIFSVVSVDSDRPEYCRAVRKAAEDDEICGNFHISIPDFEGHNFSPDELIDILWSAALENGCHADEEPKFRQILGQAASSKAMINEARQFSAEMIQLAKGKEWGARLMRYALEHPIRSDLSDLVDKEDSRRPIIKALNTALSAFKSNYGIQRREYRVEPKTGFMVKRVANVETDVSSKQTNSSS